MLPMMIVMKHKSKGERFFYLFTDGTVTEITKGIQSVDNFMELYEDLRKEGYYE